MIFITGDTHGENHNQKIYLKAKELTKDDTIIIAGDFGGVWENKGSEFYDKDQRLLDRYEALAPNILFVDGNHENFIELGKYPQVKKFNGTVGELRPSVNHLKRGQVYTIEGKTFFTCGGALSIDKIYRTIDISYWPEELLNYKEQNRALKALDEVNNEVDYIITHTCPQTFFKFFAENGLFYTQNKYNDPTCTFLDEILEKTKFKRWFFGHFHQNIKLTHKAYCLFDAFSKIEEN